MPTATADLAGRARHRAGRAALLGRLLVSEPGPQEADAARGVPSIAVAFANLADARADYARCVLTAVPCHESVFVSPDAEMGRVDPQLLEFYRRWDFTWEGRWRVAAPDQLGVQLLCFAHLCRVEERAWAADRPDLAARAVEAERELLAAHLGWWGPVAADGLARAAAGTAYGAIAEAVRELLAVESEQLRPAPEHPGLPDLAATLPPEAGTHGGPARSARRLLAPSRAGGFLTAEDIAPAAAVVGAPWRPSDTRSRLRQIVEVAVAAERMAGFVAALMPVVEGWTERWRVERDRQPGAARIYEGWRLRADATRRWLADLACRPSPATPVLHVPDTRRLAEAVAQLSAAGFVVTVTPAADDVLAAVDVAVTLDPDGHERWVPRAPQGWSPADRTT